MHDYFLSYRSFNREEALAAVGRLTAAGRTVWVDEDPQRELVGIPVGQGHWETIQQAIDAAGALVVFDTAEWHESAYCRKELDYAVETGKRVAVLATDPDNQHPDLRDLPTVPADSPEQLIDLLAPTDHLATVHARLLSELHGSTGRRHRWWSVIGHRDQARDALALTTAPVTEHGPQVTQRLSEYCDSVQAAARRRRHWLTAAGTAGLVVLAVFATVSVVADATARTRSRQARQSADHAQSLTLARQASDSNNTADALGLAERSYGLEANDATRSTLATIRDALTYRATLSVPTVPVFGWAVNDAGTVVLGNRQHSVLVGYPGTGRTVVIGSDDELGRRAAVTPDGRTGFVIGSTGKLWCVNILSRHLTASGLTGVVDLNIQPDGTVWWITSSGVLGHAGSCPGASSATESTGVPNVTAFDLSSDRTRAYALTESGQLDTVDLRQHTVRAEDVMAIPQTNGNDKNQKASTKETPYVVRCGDQVHVLNGISTEIGPLMSTWAAFNLDGTPVNGRINNFEMYGLGCGPRGDAWTDPLITPRALPLPATAQYPVAGIDDRDRGTTVIGNSPDRSHTVVAHFDGRVDVLTVTKAPWGEAVGNAAVALPIVGGTITVDTDGTARFRTGASVVAIGKLPGPPSPLSLTTGPVAVIATPTDIIELDSHRIVRTVRIPAAATSLTLSPGADEVVAGSPGWWLGIPVDPTKPTRTLRVPGLSHGERVTYVQSDGDRLLETTTFGHVMIASPTAEILHTIDLGAAGGTNAVFRMDHGVDATGATGLLGAYTPDLQPIRSLLLGVNAISIRPDVRGTTLVVALSDFSVWTVDAGTLQPQTEISIRSPDVRLVVPSSDGSRVLVLLPGSATTEANLETIPQVA